MMLTQDQIDEWRKKVSVRDLLVTFSKGCSNTQCDHKKNATDCDECLNDFIAILDKYYGASQ